MDRVGKNHDLKKKKDFLFDFFKSGIHNVIKYLTIRISGVNTASSQLHKCAHFVLLY